MEIALSEYGARVQEANWQVLAGTSTTVFTVELANPTGVVPHPLDPSKYAGADILWISGQNAGLDGGTSGQIRCTISSVVVTTGPLTCTVTISQTLPYAPAKGDRFIILSQPVITVNAPENITQVNSASVTYSSLLSPNTDLSAPTAVSVGTSAVQIDQGTANRRYVLVMNNGTATIYVGKDNTVTTSNGIPVSAGSSLSLNLGPSLQLWGISGTAGQDVRVLEAS